MLTWADGDHAFRLGWGELEMLQEACDMGPWVILTRLHSRECRVGEISHTLRCGLIGGGMTPVKALDLVRRYVEARPPAESLIHAQAVLMAGLHGAPEEGVGETDAASETAETA